MRFHAFAGRLLRAAAMLLVPIVTSGVSAPELVPAPREVRWLPTAPVPLAAGSVAIVLGREAAPPEEEGARLLREFVARRFKQEWPVVREGGEGAAHRTLIILGQRSTSRLVDELCRQRGLELDERSPGHDGYIIEPITGDGRTRVIVGGSNARGVMYGQDTLAQMLRAEGGNLSLVPAQVRDAPVIPWRGRPQTQVAHYLRPGELDLYARSRVNFIDLRSGIYAFEPGKKLDGPMIAEAVRQARRRGFIVYATVNTGVPKADYPKVMGTFRELLDLGADGLWLSFDDKGPGEDPVSLTSDVLALGRTRGIADHRIAITPPKGSYPKILTEFNRKLVAVPGMETAMWFWTAIPAAERLEEARAIGLKSRLGWWHNWPRIFTGQAYVGMPPLSLGWSEPSYPALADAGQHLDSVMPWGGNGLGQYYVVPIIAWWGWNPAGHDWNALRRRIASDVFGPAQAGDAVAFDDKLQQVFALFEFSHKSTEGMPPCPPRLRRPGDARRARGLLAEMRVALQRVAVAAPAATLVPADELNPAYLERMRATVALYDEAAQLAFPENWWPAEQRRILDAIHAGDTAAADRIIRPARERVQRELARIEQGLSAYPKTAEYLKWWRTRAGLDTTGWKALLAAQEKVLAERIVDYNRIVETKTMVEGLRSPPLEWGIGRWQVSNRLLATALPERKPRFWGDWVAGLHRQDGIDAAIFAAYRKVPAEIGEYAELPVRLPVSGQRDRLAVLLFVSSANKDLFSNTMIPYRWAGYRFIQLLWGGKVLWEQDLGATPERGEWFMIRLPVVPAGVRELDLRLRVEDRQVSYNNYTVSYVSPLRLMELPRPPTGSESE